MKKGKTVALIQARMGSSRLPGKVMKTIKGKPIIELLLKRLSKSEFIDEIIVATSSLNENDDLVTFVHQLGFKTYRGSEEDVLDRFYKAACHYEGDTIVRITADCPLVDPSLVDELIEAYHEHKTADYFCNALPPSYPDGLDVEVFSFKGLETSWKEAKLPTEREHVTQYFHNSNQFNIENKGYKNDFSNERWTLDEKEDFIVLEGIYNHFWPNIHFSWLEVIDLKTKHPELFFKNQNIMRNEGLIKSKLDEIELRNYSIGTFSRKYKEEIHTLIPGGAHTYSKGDDQFPEIAPAAIARGDGAYIWDIDGNKFLDCAMGLTSVSLGHAYEPVLKKVIEALSKGVNFQRPAEIEMSMAKEFLSLVPQHDRIKFAKNGSTVTTAAVKLARAKTGRKFVAFPADHPFYSYDDWFISSKPCNSGIPEEIGSMSLTFDSCNLDSLRALFEKYPDQIACVITEPEKITCGRSCNCNISVQDFLSSAIELTQANGAVFILDEIVTGFKTGFPGSISKFNLTPDLTTWGKGIANGFSFCALTGKKEIMDLGGILQTENDKVFLISTTHGGETHALAAAIETIKIFKSKNVIDHIHKLGKHFIELVEYVIKKHQLSQHIEIIPCEWLPALVFKDENHNVSDAYRTLLLQEMIKRGVLYQGAFVISLSHTLNDLYYFAKALDESLAVYKDALQSGYETYLNGNIIKPVFRKNN